MKRPWQIWLLYCIGLAVVVPAFAWLTVKALELDQAELLARRQAEMEEDISRALWRMDILLTPILAEEAARPDFVYRTVYSAEPAAEGKGKAKSAEQVLSPLLVDPPPYVLLHFEVYPDGRVISPQCPTGAQNSWALDNGASSAAIDQASERLMEICPLLSHSELLAQLPLQPLPTLASGQLASSIADGRRQASPPVIANTYDDFSQFSQQQRAEPTAQVNSPDLPNQQAQPNAAPAVPQLSQQAQLSDATLDPSSGPEYQQAAGVPSPFNSNFESGRLRRSQSRSGNDLPNREAALQAYAQRSVLEQRSNYKAAPPPVRIVEGVSRPLWIGDRLLLARRVQMGEQTIVQGCWLDWSALRKRLQAEVADLLPAIELMPVVPGEPIKISRLLASIPVQLSVPPLTPPAAGWTPIRVSLAVAWACLLVTAIAAAGMLHSVVTLSERRGAFVSAVTHELRTPLTTFRMYAEMLAEGMVPEAQQRQRYLETLRVEADRLAHLVENVLQYARLERGRPGKRREEVSLAGLLERIEPRLIDRATQAEMKLHIEIAPADRDLRIATDSAAVEQILFNLVDNACKYAAHADDKRVHLSLAADARRVVLAVRDHGPGISRSGRKKLFQPFSKSVHEAASTAPGVGLGLALSRRLATELGGRLEMQSPAEGGAAFVLTLPR